jgi:hypothetical protein
MGRFELPASSSRTKRASRAALHPVHVVPFPSGSDILQSFFTPRLNNNKQLQKILAFRILDFRDKDAADYPVFLAGKCGL